MKRTWRSGIIGFALLCLVACSGYARTWHIKPDGTGDAGTIQAGVDSAAVMDTVLVAAGVYKASTEVLIDGVLKTVNIHLNKNIFLMAEEPFHSAIVDYTGKDHAIFIENTQSSVLRGFSFYIPWGACTSQEAYTVYCASGCIIEFNLIKYNFCTAAIYIQDESLEPKLVRNNVLLHNYAGVHICAPNVTVENNTIFSDTDVEFGVSVFFSPNCASGMLIRNNILSWGSRAIDCYPGCDLGAFAIHCNAIYETGLDAAGSRSSTALDPSNFELFPAGNPQFCGGAAGNFYLQSDSPCAPGNHPHGDDCGFIGAYPVNCGKVGVEKKSWGTIKSLYKKDG